MNKAIISVRYPQFADRLRELGYEIIPSEEIPFKMPYERDHADLQCLILDDTAFVLKRCQRLIKALCEDYQVIECGEHFGGVYPDNVVLSAVIVGNQLICRTASLDDKVKAYCDDNGYKPINVNQGYAKCACAQVSDNAIITADKSIIQAVKNKADLLPISGTDQGFIGGASGYDKRTHTLYFCGNISYHPDCDRIKYFCEKHHTKIICLTNDRLTDIGGILFC